jgi:hypothetical protein
VYKPGPCKEVKVQCPPIKTCRKVWVPRTEYCEVKRCRTEYDHRTREVPYTVHRSLPEVKYHVVTYNVTRMVPRTHSQTLQYTVTRMVPERRESVHHYTVCRHVPEQGVRQVAYTVWRPVQSYKTVAVPRSVPKHIPITVTRLVPRTVYEKVCVTVCVPVPTCCAPTCAAPAHAAAPPAYSLAEPSYSPPVFPEGPIYGGGSYGFPPAEGESYNGGEFDSFEPSDEPLTANAGSVNAGDKAASDAKRDFQIATQDGGAEPAAQEIDPAVALEARERLAAGLRHYWAERYEAAIAEFSGAGQAHPADAKSLYFKALSQWRMNDREAANKTLAEAIAAEKTQPIHDWGKTMERVQGTHRLWIEQARRRAQVK